MRRVQDIQMLSNSRGTAIVSALKTPFNVCSCATRALFPISYMNLLERWM